MNNLPKGIDKAPMQSEAIHKSQSMFLVEKTMSPKAVIMTCTTTITRKRITKILFWKIPSKMLGSIMTIGLILESENVPTRS